MGVIYFQTFTPLLFMAPLNLLTRRSYYDKTTMMDSITMILPNSTVVHLNVSHKLSIKFYFWSFVGEKVFLYQKFIWVTKNIENGKGLCENELST